MAKLVKIYTSLEHRSNKTVKSYIDGKPIMIDFNKDRVAEVSEDILVELMKNDPSIEIVDKEVAAKIGKEQDPDGAKVKEMIPRIGNLEASNAALKETNEKLVNINEGLVEENEKLKAKNEELKTLLVEAGVEFAEEGEEELESKDEDSKITKFQLQKMKIEELKEAAKEAELPEEAWKDLTKKDLVEYLFAQLNKE